MITKEDIAEIALKILAIYLLLENITQIYATGILSVSLGQNANLPPRSTLMIIAPYLASFLMIIAGVLLWLFARKISVFLARPQAAGLTEGGTNNDLQAMLLACVGLWSFIYYFPWLLRDLFFLIFNQHQGFFAGLGNIPMTTFIAVCCHLIQVALSLWLIFGARRLSTLLNKMR